MISVWYFIYKRLRHFDIIAKNSVITYMQSFYSALNAFFGFEIGVGIPLFYGSTKAKVKTAQKDRELAEIEMRQEQTEKERDFRLCTKRLQAASNRLKYYEQNNQAHSAQISKLSAIEYENGEISYVEYVNAIEETIAVLMKHADAINEYNQAVIAIQRLTGMM